MTGTTLRDSLRQAFSRQGLSYEESDRAFHLPALDNDLIIRSGPIDGTFSINLKRIRNRRAFRQLASELKVFFRTAPVRKNKRDGYLLVVVGVAYLIFHSQLTYYQLSLRAQMSAMEEEVRKEVLEPSEK
jgi:hypothetical protein